MTTTEISTQVGRSAGRLGTVEEIERALEAPREHAEKGQLHLRLARILEQDVLGKERALQHYKMAYRYDPSAAVAVERAREIYREMGKLPILAQLYDIELQKVQEPEQAVRLLRSLASVLADLAEMEKAKACLAQALEILPDEEAVRALGDLECSEGWEVRVASLQESAEQIVATTPTGAAALLVRAGKISLYHRGPHTEALLRRAARIDPAAEESTLAIEDLLAGQDRMDDLKALHQEMLAGVSDEDDRADLAFEIGSRWILRFRDPSRGAPFLKHALELRPDLEIASTCLRELQI